MPKKMLLRYLPARQQVSEHPALRPVSKWLKNPEIWHLHRRSVSGAVFVGLFCAFLPIPFQMLLASFLAITWRCNLPLSFALVWVTNPLTITPIFYFTYRLGAWLLGMELEVTGIELSWNWLMENFSSIGYPLVVGSLVCGWVAGVSGFVIVRLLWRLHVIRHWQKRQARRRAGQDQPQFSRNEAPVPDSIGLHAAPEATPKTDTGPTTSPRSVEGRPPG
jgi:uncharacterized protein (DUF2062 family)